MYDTEELMQVALRNHLMFRTGQYLTSWERVAAKELELKGYQKCVALRIAIPKKGTRICVD